MSYNEKLANACREIISETHKKVEEKKMVGGLYKSSYGLLSLL